MHILLPLLLVFSASLVSCARPKLDGAAASSIGRTLVDIRDIDERIVVDIRYATKNNFTGEKVYPVGRCKLRRSTAESLRQANEVLRTQGAGLKVWDCYRPLSVQRRFWAILPDPRYVADPKTGSRHNRGAAVDVTLVDLAGQELEMPTAYDDFSERAHRDFTGASALARKNRDLLAEAMTGAGFTGLRTEWWHFDAAGWREHEILDIPLE